MIMMHKEMRLFYSGAEQHKKSKIRTVTERTHFVGRTTCSELYGGDYCTVLRPADFPVCQATDSHLPLAMQRGEFFFGMYSPAWAELRSSKFFTLSEVSWVKDVEVCGKTSISILLSPDSAQKMETCISPN